MTARSTTGRHCSRLQTVLGGEWPERARAAAVALTEGDSDADSIAVQLLADIREVLTEYRHTFISSRELASYLVGLEDRPWAEYSRGKPITPTKVTRMLRGFGVRAGKANLDTRGTRGYEISNFRDPFDRYLSPFQSAETPQRNNGAASSDFQSAADNDAATLSNSRKPAPDKGCGTSALSHPLGAGNEKDPELTRVLTEACAGLSVTPAALLGRLDPEDYAVVIADPRLARQLAERLGAGRS